MTPCPPQARDLLSAYLDEEVTPAERRLVEQHLAGCADCRSQLERIESLVALLARAPVEPAPAGFVQGVQNRIDHPGVGERFRWRPWMTAATSVAALFIGVAIGLQLFHSEAPRTIAPRDATIEMGRLEKKSVAGHLVESERAPEEALPGEAQPGKERLGVDERLRRLGYTGQARPEVERVVHEELAEADRRKLMETGRAGIESEEPAPLEAPRATGAGIVKRKREAAESRLDELKTGARRLMDRVASAMAPETASRAVTMDADGTSQTLAFSRRAVPVEPGLWIYAVEPRNGQGRLQVLSALQRLDSRGVRVLQTTELPFYGPSSRQQDLRTSAQNLALGWAPGEYILATFPDARSFEQFSETIAVNELVPAVPLARAAEPEVAPGAADADVLATDAGVKTGAAAPEAKPGAASAEDDEARAEDAPTRVARPGRGAGAASQGPAQPPSPAAPGFSDRRGAAEKANDSADAARPPTSEATEIDSAIPPSSPPWLRLLIWFPSH